MNSLGILTTLVPIFVPFFFTSIFLNIPTSVMGLVVPLSRLKLLESNEDIQNLFLND